jgi:hypothetical protein
MYGNFIFMNSVFPVSVHVLLIDINDPGAWLSMWKECAQHHAVAVLLQTVWTDAFSS